MQRSSWIILGVCLALGICLALLYMRTHAGQRGFSRQNALNMLRDFQTAVGHKDVGAIMDHVTTDPTARIAGLSPDRMSLTLGRAFRATGALKADVANVVFHPGQDEASVEFDLDVHQNQTGFASDDYTGHITLRIRPVSVAYLGGLIHEREWRVVGADTTGPDPAAFGD